ELLKPRRQLYKYLVHHFPDRTKWMVLRHPLLGRDVAEHSILMKVVSAHFFGLRRWIEGLLQSTLQPSDGLLLFDLHRLSFSAACYALTYLVMFAIPLIGLKSMNHRPPMWLKLAALSGFLMTLLNVSLSIVPIIKVESRVSFAIKIGGLIV